MTRCIKQNCYVFTLLLVIAIVTNSCTLSNNEKNKTRKSPKIPSFTDYNFQIELQEKFILESTIDSSIISFKAINTEKQVFYKVNIRNLASELDEIGLKVTNQTFTDGYLQGYENELKLDKIKSNYGLQKGIKSLSFNSDIKMGDRTLNVKSRLFIKGQYCYELTIMGDKKTTNLLFKPFCDSFNWLDDTEASSGSSDELVFKSSKYNYRIQLPKGFILAKAKGIHIDCKVVNHLGASFTMLVSERQREEYKITCHDYTAQMFIEEYKFKNPNFRVVKTDYINVAGEKAFLIKYLDSDTKLKTVQCYLFHRDLAYVLTGAASIDKFNTYEDIFFNSINSLSFE